MKAHLVQVLASKALKATPVLSGDSEKLQWMCPRSLLWNKALKLTEGFIHL